MDIIIQTIKNIIKMIAPDKPLKKETKEELCTIVTRLKNNDQIDTDDDVIDELIAILTKQLVNKKIKTEIKEKTEALVRKLENKIANGDDNDVDDDDGKEIMQIDTVNNDIEDSLDSEIAQYNRFTKENPMVGITWDKNNNGYFMQYNGMRKRCTEVVPLANLLIDNYKDKNKNKIYIETLITNKNYNNLLISYLHNNVELFDIRHIIKLLCCEKTNTSDKYKKFKSKITHYAFKKNDFGGYIIKQFIPLNILKEMIHSTNKVQSIKLAKLIGMEIEKYYLSKEQDTLSNISAIFSGEEIINQMYIDGYRIDMYFPKYKIAIECDENDHSDRNEIYEIERENYIKQKLNCTFMRFNPDEKNFDVNVLCNSIFKEILKWHSIKN